MSLSPLPRRPSELHNRTEALFTKQGKDHVPVRSLPSFLSRLTHHPQPGMTHLFGVDLFNFFVNQGNPQAVDVTSMIIANALADQVLWHEEDKGSCIGSEKNFSPNNKEITWQD